MSLSFIFSNLNIFALAVWMILFVIVVVRFVRPQWVKNISFPVLIALTVFLHILYGAFVTWGQYHVWATSSGFTKTFIYAPLPKEVPLPGILSGLRHSLERPLGYFAYYILGRVWLYIFISFALAGFFYVIFKIWSFYRGGFSIHGPEMLLVLMLIVGYPSLLVLVLLGFTFVLASFAVCYGIRFFVEVNKEKPRTIATFLPAVRNAVSLTTCSPIYLEPAFFVAGFVALLFGKIIFMFL